MSTLDLLVDSLNIRLPSTFANRANTIARLTIKKLAEQKNDMASFSGNIAIKKINVPPLALNGKESDHTVARKIALAIGKQIITQAENQQSRTAFNGHSSIGQSHVN